MFLFPPVKNGKIISKFNGSGWIQEWQQGINFRVIQQPSGGKISLSLCRAGQMAAPTALLSSAS